MELGVEVAQGGDGQGFGVGVALGQVAAEAAAAFAQVLHFGAVFGETEVGQIAVVNLFVGYVDAEAVAELFERGFVHFFRLVGDVLAFAGRAHAVAFDGFG